MKIDMQKEAEITRQLIEEARELFSTFDTEDQERLLRWWIEQNNLEYHSEEASRA